MCFKGELMFDDDYEYTLLVTGNGFDLNCKLKSKFYDYFEYNKKLIGKVISKLHFYKKDYLKLSNEIKEMIDSNSDIYNFWSIAFYIYYYGNSDIVDVNWFDIELLISRFLRKEVSFENKDFDFTYRNALSILEAKRKGYNIANNNLNICDSFIFFEEPKSINCYEYYIEELHKFERSFKNYLIYEVKNNKDYYKNVDLLMKEILSDSYETDLLNFNYTTISYDSICSQTNVHGTLVEKEIVIGIDSGDILNNSELRVFTKTYRNIHRLKDVFEIPEGINKIIFFGHSLAKADYSYFCSMFDMYDLYHGKLKLEFLYCDYSEDDEVNKKRHNEYVNNIYELINYYNRVSRMSENLLHRLLLEGRILVKKIKGIK